MKDPALPGWNFSHIIAWYNFWRVYNYARITVKQDRFSSVQPGPCNHHLSCLWEAVIQECSQKIIVLRSSHRDIYFQYFCSELMVKFFEKYQQWSAVFSKSVCIVLLLLPTDIEELDFITPFCWTTISAELFSKAAFMLWKIRQIPNTSL